jgi:hypothetical protein
VDVLLRLGRQICRSAVRLNFAPFFGKPLKPSKNMWYWRNVTFTHLVQRSKDFVQFFLSSNTYFMLILCAKYSSSIFMRSRRILLQLKHNISALARSVNTNLQLCIAGSGARGSVVSRGTMLRAGKSRVRFQMMSLYFSIDVIFSAAQWPWSRLSL